jgi:signal transduction histidine kinase
MATLVAVPVVSYSVARWVPGRPARIVLAFGAIGSVLGPIRWILLDVSHPSIRDLIWLMLAWFVCMGLVITPYAVGRRVRESTEAHLHRVAAAEERYRTMLTEREQDTRLAESKARTQIARELHDIVAHSLSVMIVQAEGGRAMAAKKPEAATEALNTIAETGREALSEMRRILGVLRDEPEPGKQADFAPAPRLTDIPDLVARTSDRVQLAVHGQPPKVPPAMELTAYRVVQEALTNFLKHAGPEATALVTITYGMREIAIDVLDNGVASPSVVPQNPGHGLRGMHERVSSMGGRLLTRARPSGGFQVTAVLPIAPHVSQQKGAYS